MVPVRNFLQALNSNAPGMAPTAVVNPAPAAQTRIYNELAYDVAGLDGATATTSLVFFNRPQGQADQSGAIQNKSEGDTSLLIPGQIGQNYSKNITGLTIQITPYTRTAAGSILGPSWSPTQLNWQALLCRAYVKFKIGETYFLTQPLDSIPSTLGQFNSGTTAAGTTANHVAGSGWYGAKWELAGEGVILSGNENFQVTINWPLALATADIGTSTTQGYLFRVDLHGPIAKPF